jgi:hypothetical protein
MTSVGYTHLYGSVGNAPLVTPFTRGFSPLGRGLKGFSPQANITTQKSFVESGYNRFQLVNAWNNVYKAQLTASGLNRVITPFRAVNNAGDILSRKDYSCGGSCQTPQYIARVYGIKNRSGGIQSRCDNTAVPPSTCNTRFVYDSSDYLTYLKQKAIVKNFNDLSYGGDESKASQVASRAIRRY